MRNRGNGMSDLNGKVALVTGGARGLGEFMAEALVRAGVSVYISSRKADVCEATAAQLSAQGRCVSLPFDLSNMAGVEALVGEVGARERRLDILINNAGATWGAPLDDFPESGWDRVMDLNVKSIFFLIQKLLPLLREAASPSDPARIINVGSIAGLNPGGGDNYSYKASKAAIHHLTRMLAGRLGPENITVNAIAPGPFATKMIEHLIRDPDARKRLEAGVPLRRIGGADDIGGVALFLCQRASGYISGAVIPLDGGYACA